MLLPAESRITNKRPTATALCADIENSDIHLGLETSDNIIDNSHHRLILQVASEEIARINKHKLLMFQKTIVNNRQNGSTACYSESRTPLKRYNERNVEYPVIYDRLLPRKHEVKAKQKNQILSSGQARVKDTDDTLAQGKRRVAVAVSRCPSVN